MSAFSEGERDLEIYKIVKRIMDQEPAMWPIRDTFAEEAHEGFDAFLNRLRSVHGPSSMPGARYCFEFGFKYAMALSAAKAKFQQYRLEENLACARCGELESNSACEACG